MKAEADRTRQIVNDVHLNAGDLLDRKTANKLYGNDPCHRPCRRPCHRSCQGKDLVGDWRKNKISCKETKQYTGAQDWVVNAVAGADQHFKNLKGTAMNSQPASPEHAVESQVRPWACLIKDDTRVHVCVHALLIVTKRNTLTVPRCIDSPVALNLRPLPY